MGCRLTKVRVSGDTGVKVPSDIRLCRAVDVQAWQGEGRRLPLNQRCIGHVADTDWASLAACAMCRVVSGGEVRNVNVGGRDAAVAGAVQTTCGVLALVGEATGVVRRAAEPGEGEDRRLPLSSSATLLTHFRALGQKARREGPGGEEINTPLHGRNEELVSRKVDFRPTPQNRGNRDGGEINYKHHLHLVVELRRISASRRGSIESDNVPPRAAPRLSSRTAGVATASPSPLPRRRRCRLADAAAALRRVAGAVVCLRDEPLPASSAVRATPCSAPSAPLQVRAAACSSLLLLLVVRHPWNRCSTPARCPAGPSAAHATCSLHCWSAAHYPRHPPPQLLTWPAPISPSPSNHRLRPYRYEPPLGCRSSASSSPPISFSAISSHLSSSLFLSLQSLIRLCF
ncbi:hypothetical protein Scep_009252 [Stephania cephalantha]|uniref:Uncharacterized protein n=1 Tax=Stephania cephalantha TaxID=152367 RepID=A0AAP0PG39_9MAGN